MNEIVIESTELLTKDMFQQMLTDIMIQKKIGYIDAILEICESRKLDVESINDLIDAKTKLKIKSEATSLRLLKKKKIKKPKGI